MNTVIYCRVATADQAQCGYSLTAQEKVCREYAKQKGYKVNKIFIDSGASGIDMNRIGLRKLITYTMKNKGKLSALIVANCDRLARNLCDLLELYKCFNSLNIKVLSATQNNDDNAVGRLMRNFNNCLVQYESDLKSERIKKGLHKRKRPK
jgi:site-specific DNA recombinase